MSGQPVADHWLCVRFCTAHRQLDKRLILILVLIPARLCELLLSPGEECVCPPRRRLTEGDIDHSAVTLTVFQGNVIS